MNKIDNTIECLNKFPSNMWGLETCVKITENDLLDLEEKIGYTFPQDFRYFLLNYNGITIPYEYLFGITGRKHDDILLNYYFEHSKDLLKPMLDYLIPFCPNGRGDYYCFNKNDNKIYFWQHDCDDSDFNPDYDNESFTDWLEENIKLSLESIVN